MHIFCVITTILCNIDSSKQQKKSSPPKKWSVQNRGSISGDSYHLFCDALKGN